MSFTSLDDDLLRRPLQTAIASKYSLGRGLASAQVGEPEDADVQIVHALVVPSRWDQPGPWHRLRGHVDKSEPGSRSAIACLAHSRGLVARTTSPVLSPISAFQGTVIRRWARTRIPEIWRGVVYTE